MKTIIITGANGNLGTITVKHFLERGYRVVAIDANDNNLVFARESETFSMYLADLSDEEAAATVVQQVLSLGPVYGALLLAGGFTMGTMAESGLKEVNRMKVLNFDTSYNIARPVFAHMLERQEGRIVFVGARPALKPAEAPNKIAYALSKSMLVNLAAIMNAQSKGTNVVASVIVPSTIDTKPNRESMPNADRSGWIKPEEIAEVLEFICGESGGVVRDGVFFLGR